MHGIKFLIDISNHEQRKNFNSKGMPSLKKKGFGELVRKHRQKTGLSQDSKPYGLKDND